MKKQKDRFTANQLDQAIMDEVKQKQNLNIPANSISSAMAFCEMVNRRLCGERPSNKRVSGYIELLKDVINAAKAERSEEELKKQEQARAQESKIILPGRPRDPRAN